MKHLRRTTDFDVLGPFGGQLGVSMAWVVGRHVVKRVLEGLEQLGDFVVVALLRLCNCGLGQVIAQHHTRVGGEHAVLNRIGGGLGVLLQAL